MVLKENESQCRHNLTEISNSLKTWQFCVSDATFLDKLRNPSYGNCCIRISISETVHVGKLKTKLRSSNHIIQIKKKKTRPPLSNRKTQGIQYVLKVLYVLLDGVNNWIGGEGELEGDEEPAQN